MNGTAGSHASIRLARDAIAFIERVEAEARRRGSEVPGLHHWLAAACRRPFLARTIASDDDIRAADALAHEALGAGTPGPALAREAVLEAATVAAVARGDTRIHAWHLVYTVLHQCGIATRETATAIAPTEPDAGPGAATPPETVPASPAKAPRPAKARRATSPSAPPRPPTPLLDECGTDWTVAAARGELPPMVGRDAELALLIEGLCRPTKPNVLLVGLAGVGKSALVEGLAQRMASGDVPAALRGRPLIALSMAQVTRESRYYGVMEHRLSELLAEAVAVRAILFIDEGHAMTGAGGREGTGDVASVLKPALARGGVSLITATTEQEYQRFILPNAALERRFTVVHLAEPGREAVRAMLAAHRDAIAGTHAVLVDDAALDRLLEVTAVTASHRFEPDRSRDLLDQAVARAIAAGCATVGARDVEATAGAAAGVPDVTDASLTALGRALTDGGLASEADGARLVDRLGTAFAGLALRPQRPRATVLVLRSSGGAGGGGGAGVDGLVVAEALATGVFGGPERVITIDIGGIAEPSAITGFLGTTQGFIGHGAHLPIHGLAERPHSVLLLRGVDACHETLRSLVARAIRDGFLTDAQARRIALSSAIVVLEASAPRHEGRRLGFGAREPHASANHGRSAAASIGRELAAECDLVIVPPDGSAAERGWVSSLLGRLAASYRAVGIHLAWDVEVETLLAADLRDATSREREHALETRLGRIVRPLLHAREGPLRIRARAGVGGLVVDAEARDAAG